MGPRGCVLCAFLFGIFPMVFTGDTEVFFFDEMCGNTINMDVLAIASGRLLLRRSDTGLVNFNCVVYIRAPSSKRLLLKVTQLDIVAPFGCSRDYLQLFDGPTSTEPLTSGLCGYEAPGVAYQTTRQDVSVVFAKNMNFNNDQFEVIFTAYHKGPCGDGDFSCKNGLCIAERLWCDGFDNCGDGSDICVLSIAGIIGIAIAVAVVLIIIALVVAFVVQRRRRRRLEKWHRLHHTYSFNGSSTLSLPRSRRDYSLPRSIKSSSFRSGTLPRSGNDFFMPRDREDSVVYATVMKDKANHKIHILNAASLPRDIHPKGPEMDHVVSFRSYPAPVPEKDDEIVHSTPQPHPNHDGFFFGSGKKHDLLDDKKHDHSISRNPSSAKSAISTKSKTTQSELGGQSVTTNTSHGREGDNKPPPMIEVTDHSGLKDGSDILFHNDTTDLTTSTNTRDRDARGSFDLVRL